MEDSVELDRLCELAHVGAGHAAGALAQLLGEPLRVSVPRVRLGDAWSTDATADPAESDRTSGVFFEVQGGIGGVFAVLLTPAARHGLLEALLGEPAPDGEQVESALREVGNILASHALSALADLLDTRVLPSVPVLAMEHAGAVLADWSARSDGHPDLRIENELLASDGSSRALLLWIPAPPRAAGVEKEDVDG